MKSIHEENIILALKELKEVIPSANRMDRIEQGIYKKIEMDTIDRRSSNFRYFPKRSSLFLAITMCFVLFFIGVVLFKQPLQQEMFAVRIAFASNHYEKTKVAFEEAQIQLQSMDTSDASAAQKVMDTTAITNAFISHLHLEGEKGKYTSQQCKSLYQAYALYLNILQKQLAKENKKAFEEQALLFEQEAQSRLAYFKT